MSLRRALGTGDPCFFAASCCARKNRLAISVAISRGELAATPVPAPASRLHADPAEVSSLPSPFGAWLVKPAPLPRTIPRLASTRPTISAIRDRSSCAYAIGVTRLRRGSVWIRLRILGLLPVSELASLSILELIVTPRVRSAPSQWSQDSKRFAPPWHPQQLLRRALRRFRWHPLPLYAPIMRSSAGTVLCCTAPRFPGDTLNIHQMLRADII